MSAPPRRSSSTSKPAAPMAMPTVPRRQGRFALSTIKTPTDIPVAASNAWRMREALASGSFGSSSASASSPWSMLDWSTPAWAPTSPSLCRTISTPGFMRTTALDSSRINCTRRGSFSVCAASSRASAEGTTPANATCRPSALETIFCATVRMSPSCKARPLAASASHRMAGRSSPASTSLMPDSGATWKPTMGGAIPRRIA